MNELPASIFAALPNEQGAGTYTGTEPKLYWESNEYVRVDLAAPKIKPLVWGYRTIPDGGATGIWMASRSIVGMYEIHTFEGTAHSDVYFLDMPGQPKMQIFPTEDAAKAAAQADFERRVKECLE